MDAPTHHQAGHGQSVSPGFARMSNAPSLNNEFSDDLDFYLGQPLLPVDPAGFGSLRLAGGSSHDDSCLDDCVALGLYNGPNSVVVHHRSAPFATHTRNRHSLGHPGYGYYHHSILFPNGSQNHTPVLGPSHYIHDVPEFSHLPRSFGGPPSLGRPDGTFSRAVARRIEDDGQSVALSSRCCDSQCLGEACTGTSCATEASACYDQNCAVMEPGVTSEVADAAAALTSIGGGLDQQQSFFSLLQPDFDGIDFYGSAIGHAHGIDPVILQSTLDSVKQHLLGEHSDRSRSSPCVRPCPVDNPLLFSECHFSQFQAGASSDASHGTYNHDDGDAVHQHEYDCGAKIKDGDEFITHFNLEHRPVITSASVLHPTQAPLSSASSTALSQATIVSRSSSSSTPVFGPSPGSSFSTPHSNFADGLVGTPSTVGSRALSTSHQSATTSPMAERSGPQNRCLWRDTMGSPVCGNMFFSGKDLIDHIISAHTQTLIKSPTGFRCGWQGCPREDGRKEAFKNKSKIERHMRTHTDYKPFVCEICDEELSAKQALEQHLRIHSGEKPLSCDFPGCKSTFRQNSALTMHKRTHTGEKPLMCDICGKCFSESSNLSKHRRTHESTGRYTCPYQGCSRGFHRQDQLRRHIKHHQKKALVNGTGTQTG